MLKRSIHNNLLSIGLELVVVIIIIPAVQWGGC